MNLQGLNVSHVWQNGCVGCIAEWVVSNKYLHGGGLIKVRLQLVHRVILWKGTVLDYLDLLPVKLDPASNDALLP